MVAAVIQRFGRLEVLINDAVIGTAEETSIAQAQRIFGVNVLGVMRMTNAVLPHMRAKGTGRIVDVSSVLGFLPAPFAALDAASEHAVEGYSGPPITRPGSTASGSCSSSPATKDRRSRPRRAEVGALMGTVGPEDARRHARGS